MACMGKVNARRIVVLKAERKRPIVEPSFRWKYTTKDRQCKYKVRVRHVRATMVALEKQ